jgi:hypothetical protein
MSIAEPLHAGPGCRDASFSPMAGTANVEVVGIQAGRALLAWQRPWPKGTRLAAWCVAHYRLDGGRIAGSSSTTATSRRRLPTADRV